MTVPAPNATPTFNPDECKRLGRKASYANVIPLVGWLMSTKQSGPKPVRQHHVVPGLSRTDKGFNLMTDTSTSRRRLFWDQGAADAGDQPYFPEFLSPDDPAGWRLLSADNSWFVYILHTSRVRNPLYVGFTSDVHRRLNQHRKIKAWWPLVDQIIVDRYSDRSEALEAEDRFIYHAKPLLNVVGNQHTRDVGGAE